MDAIDILRSDHRHIERILKLVLEEVAKGRRGGKVDPRLLGRAADFFGVFVEGAHFDREEALHEALIRSGMPLTSGLLGQLAAEHATGREQTRALKVLAAQVAAGETAQEALWDQAEDYIRMLQAHSGIEERELLPLAQRLLRPAQQDALRSEFAKVEARYGPLCEASLALQLAFGDRQRPQWGGGLRR